MASQADERTMISERVAPGMLPRVLNSFDMTVIFVAIVLFVVNSSAIQQAHQAAYTYWILGFLLFLIPGALVTAQLGQMFPHEGSLYVWTQKALGPFWGFFAAFCAWWPGILVMVATGDAVVGIWQFVDKGGLPKAWEQGLVILAVLWFSAAMSLMRLRMTQSYANWAVVFYGVAIFVIGLAGILWLVGDGHSATGGWGTGSNWSIHSGQWTWFGFVILALLGIEVPLNMGVEIVHMRAIKKYLFWGFFAGFCAWWPGILVMVATGDAVVTIWQFVDKGGLPKAWEQGLVILAVLWFSALMSMLRLRMTQSYANWAVVFYGAAIFVIGLAGILYLIGAGKSATGGWGTASNWNIHSGQWTWFGFVILALLGIEVPLNMGVEIVHLRSIKKYLFWGSIVVMFAYLWATLGTMLALPAAKSVGATTDILSAVQVGFFGSHAFAIIVALVLLWFFVSNTIVYNYSFSRLLFVSGLEQRMPPKLGTVNEKTKVPVYAIVTQTVLSSLFVIAIFNPWMPNNNTQKAYWLFQAAVTVIWCVSMVLLFADIFLVKRAFPEKFEEVRVSHPCLLYASGIIGMLASAFGAYVTFRSPWTSLFTIHNWRIWLAVMCAVSVAAAIVIYAISEYTHRRETRHPSPSPA